MSMQKLTPGRLVKSAAGHDQGRIYIIVGMGPPPFILIADGRSRKAGRPKKKNARHLSDLGFVASNVAEKLRTGGCPTDEELRGAINRFNDREPL